MIRSTHVILARMNFSKKKHRLRSYYFLSNILELEPSGNQNEMFKKCLLENKLSTSGSQLVSWLFSHSFLQYLLQSPTGLSQGSTFFLSSYRSPLDESTTLPIHTDLHTHSPLSSLTQLCSHLARPAWFSAPGTMRYIGQKEKKQRRSVFLVLFFSLCDHFISKFLCLIALISNTFFVKVPRNLVNFCTHNEVLLDSTCSEIKFSNCSLFFYFSVLQFVHCFVLFLIFRFHFHSFSVLSFRGNHVPLMSVAVESATER